MKRPLTAIDSSSTRISRLVAIMMFSIAAICLGGCKSESQPPSKIAEIPAGSFMTKKLAELGIEKDEASDVFVRDDLLIVYTKDHVAYVLDRESLGSKWVKKIADRGVRVRAPVVLKDFVVFPTISTMEIYDRNGRNHRSVPTGGLALRSGAVGVGTHVFFGADATGGGRVVNLDLAGTQYQQSSKTWELQTRGGISATPAIQQGLLYVGDDAGNVYAVNAESRAPVWPVKQEGREEGVFGVAGGVRGDVRADEYGVYFASTDTKLYCLNRTDGRIRWQYFAGQPLQHSPAVTATTVYEYIEGQGLIAIDKTQGEPVRKAKWVVANAIQFLAEDEKHVYLERRDHAIIAVDKATGSAKFESLRKDFVAFATSLKNNVIYGTTRDGQVRAIVPVFNAGTIGEIVMSPTKDDSVAAVR